MKTTTVFSLIVATAVMVTSSALGTPAFADNSEGTLERKADTASILGKWVLAEDTAGIPKGTVFDFQKNGTLEITLGELSFEYEYELKGTKLWLVVEGKRDYTEVTTLTKTDLVWMDTNGFTAKFKRAR